MVPLVLKEIKNQEVVKNKTGNSKGMSNVCILKYHYTYQTKNLINGKTYIGRHSTNNLKDGYIGSGTMLKRAIKKYGKENFKTIPLCYFDTYKESVEEEKFLVTREYCKDINNYNIVEGGSNPIMYGIDNPSWKGGVKYIPKGRPIMSGKDNPMYGRKIPDSQIKQALNTKKNKGLLISIITLDNTFDSISECASYYNISESTVDSRCVSPHFKEWRYLDYKHQEKREQVYKNKVEKRYERKKLKTFENKKPVIFIDEIPYYSFQEVGRKYGIYWETVQKRGVSKNFKNWVFPNNEDFEKYKLKFQKIIEKDRIRNKKHGKKK